MPSRDVWRMPKAGSLAWLRRDREDLADPGAGDVRVRVGAVGLNFADIFACMGLYSATPGGAFTPGLEFAGTVEAVGGAVSVFRPGDQVFGLTRFGAYATHVTVDARYLHPLPPGWTAADGAAFPVQALTAWYAIDELGALHPGDSVLVHSAAGGVGLNALALLRSRHAQVVATVGHESKRAFLVQHAGLAPHQIIVRDRRTFGAQLDAALEANRLTGFHLVLDSVAGPFFKPAYRRLHPAGRLVIFGSADLMPTSSRPNWLRLWWQYRSRPRVDPLAMISHNKSVMGFKLIWLWSQVDRLAPAYQVLTRDITAPPYIGRRFPFAEAPAAMRHLQRGENVGKVVLEV
ncbi:MAG: zinc-binding dehydrogenase [Acidobacteria bacterium]|nr:zinc-binding dehydrogenase [Acidobacteriota bacterium]